MSVNTNKRLSSLYLGIDFSGDYRMWRHGCGRSNVWIAWLTERARGLELLDLCRVQELPGNNPPFIRLAGLLGEGGYRAAAIDAPFSVPHGFLPRQSHRGLLDLVDQLECEPGHRPFPRAARFVRAVAGRETCDPPKPLRVTEQRWRTLGLNVRSTLWCGPRGGAAMTAAALKLLRKTERPLWPWCDPGEDGLLAEAFPAAQLRQWGQHHDQYNGPAGCCRRKKIVRELQCVSALRPRVILAEAHRKRMLGSADALDAVLAAYAARAVARDLTGPIPKDVPAGEGWIAVHKLPRRGHSLDTPGIDPLC